MPACPHCYQNYTVGQPFCEHCGGDVSAVPVGVMTPPGGSPAPPSIRPQGNEVTCANCGRLNAAGSQFCDRCGSSLAGGVPNNNPMSATAPRLLMSTGQTLPLPPQPSIRVGRADPSTGNWPDID